MASRIGDVTPVANETAAALATGKLEERRAGLRLQEVPEQRKARG